jgi:hypothetical protein
VLVFVAADYSLAVIVAVLVLSAGFAAAAAHFPGVFEMAVVPACSHHIRKD